MQFFMECNENYCMEMKRKNKDKYKYFFIALWIMVPLFVVMDIFAFLYGEPYSFNSYPILPFNVQPSYVRGIHRLCYTIDGIFESPVCADNCETIPNINITGIASPG